MPALARTPAPLPGDLSALRNVTSGHPSSASSANYKATGDRGQAEQSLAHPQFCGPLKNGRRRLHRSSAHYVTVSPLFSGVRVCAAQKSRFHRQANAARSGAGAVSPPWNRETRLLRGLRIASRGRSAERTGAVGVSPQCLLLTHMQRRASPHRRHSPVRLHNLDCRRATLSPRRAYARRSCRAVSVS